MKITEIIENKDQITPETIKNPDLPNGVMFVVDPKWAPRRIFDEACTALGKCGNMDVLLVPAPVWELVEKFEMEKAGLQRELGIKVGLNQHYADRIVELEAELHESPKKKEANFLENGVASEVSVLGDKNVKELEADILGLLNVIESLQQEIKRLDGIIKDLEAADKKEDEALATFLEERENDKEEEVKTETAPMEEVLDREATTFDSQALDSGLGIPEDRNLSDDEDLAARGDTNIGLEGPDGDPDERDR